MLDSSVIIRRGVAADAPALAELASRTFRETFTAGNRAEDLEAHLAAAYGTTQQLRELADPAIVTLLAEYGGHLAGYAQLRSGTTPACVSGEAPIELWRFYIAQGWHGRGVAQSLMSRADAEARGTGRRTLWLGVWEHNERAKAFYRKSGFVDVGSHVFMLGSDAQTDRVMVRPVANPASGG